MIHVETRGPCGPEFRKWYRKALEERKKLLKHWEACRGSSPAPRVFHDAGTAGVWSELKAIFLHEVFHYKCAYCEAKSGATNSWQVEHYRPKSEVTEGRKRLDSHPGYFWLAYEWYNLLLSCGHCNTWEERTPKNERQTNPSKSNEFRVKGPRVGEPGRCRKSWMKQLQDEQPLLLNPYFDEPADHLAFVPGGYVYGLTERGRETVDVCNLNRIELVEARFEAKEAVTSVLGKRLHCDECVESPVDRYFGPDRGFSGWLNYYVQVKLSSITPGGSGARRPSIGSGSSSRQPEKLLGYAQAARVILRDHAGGLTPEQLKPSFWPDKAVRVDDVLKTLVLAGMVQKRADGKYSLA